MPKNVVVQIGHLQITKAEYERAMAATAVQDAHSQKYEPSPLAFQLAELATKLKEATLIVPVPPDFTACVARWRRFGIEPGKPTPSTSELKTLCQKEYQALQQEALTPLIVTDWNLAEAAEDGVNPTEAEVRQQLEAETRKRVRSESEFQKYLSSFGVAKAEVLQQAKVGLIRERLNEKAIPNHSKLSKGEVNQSLSGLTVQFEDRWKVRTVCAAGFVVPYCKDYKPPPPEPVKPQKPPVVTAAPVTPPPPPSTPSTPRAGS